MAEFQIPTAPSMPQAAVARLETALRVSECYMEYGSGGSTALAMRSGIKSLICVESDKAWLEKLQESLPAIDSVHSVFVHGDIGPTKEWGHPTDDRQWRRFHTYPLAGWLAARSHDLSPDLVLLDGRFRRACFYSSLVFAKPGTVILFDDYQDRRFYHSVERFAQPWTMHDRMAEFVVPDSVDKTEVWLALVEAVTEVH